VITSIPNFAPERTCAVFSDGGTRTVDLSVEASSTGARAAENLTTEVSVTTSDSLILRAIQDATKFHDGQKRRFKDDPHMFHVMRVVGRVMMLPDVTVPEITGTAWHDVGEDFPRDVQAQQTLFSLHEDRYGTESLVIMKGLTKPSVFMRNMTKADMLQMDLGYMKRQPFKVKRIKALDRIDNLKEFISDLFAGRGDGPRASLDYALESEALAVVLQGIEPELMTELVETTKMLRHVASTIYNSQI
jgi:hypothetical protein